MKIKSKWNILFIILALLMLFSLFAVPKIASGVMNGTKNRIFSAYDGLY